MTVFLLSLLTLYVSLVEGEGWEERDGALCVEGGGWGTRDEFFL